VEGDLVKGVSDIGAEAEEFAAGAERSSVGDDVGGEREDYAFALMNQCINLRAEEIPDEPVFPRAVGLPLADESKFGDRHGGNSKVVRRDGQSVCRIAHPF
jgi:hypothetical protein